MVTRVVCVLGMHRSGTSCLTGTLEQAGVYLGEVFRQNPFNAKGNRENGRIMQLHEDLLKSNGGSWDNPPEQVVWNRHHRAAQADILADYAGKQIWGFKDPRTLFTLDGWLDRLTGLPVFIGTFRHPLAVARSLQNRNQFPIDQSVALWARYNRRLIAYHDRFEFPIISFDEPSDVLCSHFEQILAALQLHAPGPKDQFFSQELRHHSGLLEEAPASVRPLYEELRRRSWHSLDSRQHREA